LQELIMSDRLIVSAPLCATARQAGASMTNGKMRIAKQLELRVDIIGWFRRRRTAISPR
jgi:hypothetical protein